MLYEVITPEADPLGAGYNIIQSQIALGSGGLFGKGWLNGTQSQLEFLPERHTDFIFAVFSEEFGLIGFCLLLALYLYVLSRCMIISVNAQGSFERLLGGALTLTFFVYVFVNIGMVSGLLPVVGVPLPLVRITSYNVCYTKLLRADTVRLFMMFASPADMTLEWQESGVEGAQLV